MGLQYGIVYRSDSSNCAADALSCHPAPPAVCAVVTAVVPSWVAVVQASYTEDPSTQVMLTKLVLDSAAVPNFSLHFSLLRYRNRIWIGSDPALQQRLFAEFHASAWGCHSRVPVSYMRLKQCFTWKGMKAAIRAFVQACSVCQQSKHDPSKAPGLLQYLLVQDSAWQVISMDFIE